MSKTVGAGILVTGVALFLLLLARFDGGGGREGALDQIDASEEPSEEQVDADADDWELADVLPARTEPSERTAVESDMAVAVAEGAQPDAVSEPWSPSGDQCPPWVARGIVLAPDGTPVAGAEILRLGNEKIVAARTSGDGRFEVALELSSVAFIARSEGFRTVFGGVAAHHLADEDAVIMVARVVHIEGIVAAESGAPVGGAAMTIDIPWEGVVGFPLSLERSLRQELAWSSDEDGAFDLKDVPVALGVPLSTVADGFNPTETELPLSDQYGVVIELQSSAAASTTAPSEEHMFFGFVQSADGRPVKGARVFLDSLRGESDASGRWEFARGGHIRPGTPLAAIHDSEGAGILPFADAWNGSSQSFGPLFIALDRNDLAIEGRVLDSDGRGLKGWTVQILDPTYVGLDVIPAPTLETGGKAESGGAETDKKGRFRIAGLVDREYDIRAYSSSSFLSIARTGVLAGTSDLELRLPEDATIEELRVLVKTRDGLPVPSATVGARFILERSRSGHMSRTGATGVTDEEGIVLLSKVPRRGVDLVAAKPGIITSYLYTEDKGFEGDAVELVVDRAMKVIVDGSRMETIPERVRMVDENGKELMISSQTANGSTSSTTLSLDGGISAVVTVSEAAREMVLLQGWEEAERVPIQLVPGTITRIELP